MALINIKWVADDRDKKILFESAPSNNKEKKHKGMVIDWIKKYKWESNPFIDEILEPLPDYAVGYEQEKKQINLFFVQNNRFGLIKGPSGIGKTTILRWVAGELKPFEDKYKVYFVSVKDIKKDFISNIVKPFLSFSILNKNYTPHEAVQLISKHSDTKKQMIFLIDDIHNLDSINQEFLKDLISSVKNISILCTSNSDAKHSIKEIGKDELGMELKEITFDGIYELVKKRIERVDGIDIDPFTVVQLKTITKKASGNPREVLSLCTKKAAELALMGNDPSAKDADIDKDDLKELEAELSVYNKNAESIDNTKSSQKSKENSNNTEMYEGDRIVQEVLGGMNEKGESEKTESEESTEPEKSKTKSKKSTKSKK